MKQNTINPTLPLGIALTAAVLAAYRLPAVPATLEDYVTADYVDGPVGTVTLTLTDCPVTLSDTTQGGNVKLLDFPAGLFRSRAAFGSLTITTTSTLASTLNASKALLWSLGTAAQSTVTLAGDQGNLLPAVSATSSATVNVANTATIGRRLEAAILNGASTPADAYLNIAVPTATDIDGDATVTVSGTITLWIEDLGETTTLGNASRMPSAAIWGNCPWSAIASGELDGHAVFEDFLGNFVQANNVAAAASTLPSPFAAFTGATAGGTISQPADAPIGVAALNNTTNDETTCLVLGGKGLAGQWVFEAGKSLWFEARIKINTIADTKMGLFCGFGEEGLCVTVGICAADDTLTDKDLIGFFHVAGDGDMLDTVYKTAGGAGTQTHTADAVTLVADTYVKVGITCDGTSIRFYKDGVQIGAALALSAAEVPDGEEMCFYLAMTSSGGDDIVSSIDWVKIAQLRA